MADQKITPEQKDEIFEAYVQIHKPSERWGFETKMASQYGVHRSTIHKITHDEKRIRRYLLKAQKALDIAMIQAMNLAVDGLHVQAGYIHSENLDKNMEYLRQQAAVDVMNRAGLKREKEEAEKKLVIAFDGNAGFALGSPQPAEEQGEADG